MPSPDNVTAQKAIERDKEFARIRTNFEGDVHKSWVVQLHDDRKIYLSICHYLSEYNEHAFRLFIYSLNADPHGPRWLAQPYKANMERMSDVLDHVAYISNHIEHRSPHPILN